MKNQVENEELTFLSTSELLLIDGGGVGEGNYNVCNNLPAFDLAHAIGDFGRGLWDGLSGN